MEHHPKFCHGMPRCGIHLRRFPVRWPARWIFLGIGDPSSIREGDMVGERNTELKDKTPMVEKSSLEACNKRFAVDTEFIFSVIQTHRGCPWIFGIPSRFSSVHRA